MYEGKFEINSNKIFFFVRVCSLKCTMFYYVYILFLWETFSFLCFADKNIYQKFNVLIFKTLRVDFTL